MSTMAPSRHCRDSGDAISIIAAAYLGRRVPETQGGRGPTGVSGSGRRDDQPVGAVFARAAVVEAEALAVDFEDMDMMGEAVKQRPGQALRAERLVQFRRMLSPFQTACHESGRGGDGALQTPGNDDGPSDAAGRRTSRSGPGHARRAPRLSRFPRGPTRPALRRTGP